MLCCLQFEIGGTEIENCHLELQWRSSEEV